MNGIVQTAYEIFFHIIRWTVIGIFVFPYSHFVMQDLSKFGAEVFYIYIERHDILNFYDFVRPW